VEFVKLVGERYQEFLLPAIEKLSRATTPSDYRDVITDVRRFLSKTGELYNALYDTKYEQAIKSLYLYTSTFQGEGASNETSKEADEILGIMAKLEGMASGLGVHAETKDKTNPQPYVSYPQKEDAKYLLLVSLLTADYIMRKTNRLVQLRG